MNISRAARNLLNDLRAEQEGKNTEPDGSVWACVYLPNAQGNRSRAQFGGLLLALKEAGYYRHIDGYFGSVKL